MPHLDDVQILFGGEVKALTDQEDGKVGGYLVYFGTADETDITKKKDFFTKNTDFDLETSTKSTVLYDHALDPTLKRRKLGVGEMKVDDIGVWIEGQLNMRDEYEQAIYAMAKAGKLGWSSGVPSHLVERKACENGAHEILSWPLGKDASLTPTPAEPRTLAITSLKSYQEHEFKALRFVRVDEEKPADAPAPETKTADKQFITVEIKAVAAADSTPTTGSGLFEKELAKRTQQVWELWSSVQTVFERIGKAARSGDMLGVEPDVEALVKDAIDAFVARLTPAVVKQINDFAGGEGSPDYFYIKSSLDALTSGLASDLPIQDHSEVVASAVTEIATKSADVVEQLNEFTQRAIRKQKFREETKAGRKLSAATVENIGTSKGKIKDTIANLQAIHDEMDALMESAKPKEEPTPVVMAKSADDETIRQLLAETLHIESRFALHPQLSARAA